MDRYQQLNITATIWKTEWKSAMQKFIPISNYRSIFVSNISKIKDIIAPLHNVDSTTHYIISQ